MLPPVLKTVTKTAAVSASRLGKIHPRVLTRPRIPLHYIRLDRCAERTLGIHLDFYGLNHVGETSFHAAEIERGDDQQRQRCQ
jgi:hypothetical protein